MSKIFLAYPGKPTEIGQCINLAVDDIRRYARSNDIVTWPEMDIAGKFIANEVFNNINLSEIVIADITYLNFNVTYEIAYALTRGKKLILVRNASLTGDVKKINELGIFDTMGYETYNNNGELKNIILAAKDKINTGLPNAEKDTKQPVYIIESRSKDDIAVHINSKIKKSGLKYRRFDPVETPRLSAYEAIRSVKASFGVIVRLLDESLHVDSLYNNHRAAFIAGLCLGFEKPVLIFQHGDGPVPLDYRDLVSMARIPLDCDPFIHDFVAHITQDVLGYSNPVGERYDLGFLARLNLGSPAAEDEATELAKYYLITDEFQKALRGEARLAVGRKGSGKTALFIRLRDKLRDNKKNIVLDFKPEGHQLKRLREQVLNLLSESAREHVSTCFWEYILLLEIAHKLLEKDRNSYSKIDQHSGYAKLEKLCGETAKIGEADFSERMMYLVEKITGKFRESGIDIKNFDSNRVIELVYSHDIKDLYREITEYLTKKERVVILFDNLDKGWPTRGVERVDLVILRSLLDATQKLNRHFQKNDIPFQSTVFIRNDVFELLVQETSDRGKDSKVSLEWTDRARLKEFIKLRFIFGGMDKSENFDNVWNGIFATHVEGAPTLDLLIERSLLRPRNLLNIILHCKAYSLNLQKDKVDSDDIVKALQHYSADLAREISMELQDIYAGGDSLIYEFIGRGQELTLNELKTILSTSKIPEGEINRIIEILLWFSFIGVRTQNEEVRFIYDVFYDIKKLLALGCNLTNGNQIFIIHSAFKSFLDS